MKKLLILLAFLITCASVASATDCAANALGHGAVCATNNNTDIFSATSVSQAFGTNNTAGNTILLFFRCNVNTGCNPTVGDSRNSYTQKVECTTQTGPAEQFLYEADNIGAGANTVTITSNGTNSIEGFAVEVSGLQNPAFDQSACGTSVSSVTTGSTTAANEIVIGYGRSNASVTTGTGFTSFIAKSSGEIENTEFMTTAPSTTGTQTCVWGSSPRGVLCATFKTTSQPAGGGNCAACNLSLVLE